MSNPFCHCLSFHALHWFINLLCSLSYFDLGFWSHCVDQHDRQESSQNAVAPKLGPIRTRRIFIYFATISVISSILQVQTLVLIPTKFCQTLPNFKSAVVLPQSRTNFCQMKIGNLSSFLVEPNKFVILVRMGPKLWLSHFAKYYFAKYHIVLFCFAKTMYHKSYQALFNVHEL